VAALEGHEGGVISLNWTNTFQLLSGSWDESGIIWNFNSKSKLLTLPNHENGVTVLGDLISSCWL